MYPSLARACDYRICMRECRVNFSCQLVQSFCIIKPSRLMSLIRRLRKRKEFIFCYTDTCHFVLLAEDAG